MNRAYKTELDPSESQSAYLRQCAGTARFIYNWALADRIKTYQETGKSGSSYEQCKRFNSIKREIAPWITEMPYAVGLFAFLHLDIAYKNFFRRIKNGEKPGYPKFKSRYKTKDSFTVNGSINVFDKAIKIPRMRSIRLKERGYLPDNLKIKYATISRRGSHWFVSILVEIPEPKPLINNAPPLGIDFGLKDLAICSNGRVFKNDHLVQKFERKLRILNKELSRRTKGGQNWNKTKKKLADCHYKLARLRQNALHKISKYAATSHHKAVIIEDLNVSGMVRNHHLAKAISDVGWSELRRQIDYKCKWSGTELVIADKFYPSSKTCSHCGLIRDIKLSERKYICDCGFEIDRDINAARNLAAYQPANGGSLPAELDCINDPR